MTNPTDPRVYFAAERTLLAWRASAWLLARAGNVVAFLMAALGFVLAIYLTWGLAASQAYHLPLVK